MKKQAPNYIPAIILIVAVVALTAVCGYFLFKLSSILKLCVI